MSTHAYYKVSLTAYYTPLTMVSKTTTLDAMQLLMAARDSNTDAIISTYTQTFTHMHTQKYTLCVHAQGFPKEFLIRGLNCCAVCYIRKFVQYVKVRYK